MAKIAPCSALPLSGINAAQTKSSHGFFSRFLNLFHSSHHQPNSPIKSSIRTNPKKDKTTSTFKRLLKFIRPCTKSSSPSKPSLKKNIQIVISTPLSNLNQHITNQNEVHSFIRNHQEAFDALKKETIIYFDNLIAKEGKSFQLSLCKSLISMKVNQKKNEYASSLFENTKKVFSAETWQYLNKHNQTLHAIHKFIDSSFNNFVRQTDALTKHIGHRPESWAVADATISSYISTALSKSMPQLMSSAYGDAVKKILNDQIFDYYAHKYYFPTCRNIDQLFSRFYQDLDVDRLVQI